MPSIHLAVRRWHARFFGLIAIVTDQSAATLPAGGVGAATSLSGRPYTRHRGRIDLNGVGILRRFRARRGCTWCQSADADSEEDVIARWIAALFVERFWRLSPNLQVQGAGRWYDMDEAKTTPAKRVRILIPACSSCDNGWMSELESKVGPPVLTPLVSGDPLTMRDPDADILAAWAFKTLVNAAFERHRRASTIVRPDLRQYLVMYRTPPPEVSLEAFRVQGLDTKIRTGVKDVALRKQGRPPPRCRPSLDGADFPSRLPDGHAPEPWHPSAETSNRRREGSAATLAARYSSGPAGQLAFTWPPGAAVTGETEFDDLADPAGPEVWAWIL